MGAENTPLIEAKNLKFSYRKSEKILKGVSFEIGKGEFVAVTGPSGSGKSTLFYLLGCLLDKYSGDVVFRGKSTKAMSPEEKSWLRNKEIGFVFQQFYLLPRASVRDNILLPTYFPFDDSKPSAEDLENVETIAENLGIKHLLERTPQELSGGQQQRVAIARALIRKPGLILADEPTGNLDSKSSESVMQLLKKLHNNGHTVVIVTHSPEIAAKCSRVLHIKDGVLERDERYTDASHQTQGLPEIDLNHLKFGGLGIESFIKSLPIAWENIKRSQAKSALTMLGVILGVAAVLSTLSLGAFAKRKILEGYQSLGVNTLRFSGYINWSASSADYAPASFRDFKWSTDILPLKNIFQEIEAASPYMVLPEPSLRFGGREYSDNTSLIGVNESYFSITGQNILEGRALSTFDTSSGAPTCVIGHDIKAKLFANVSAINQSIGISNESIMLSLPCRVVGVLQKQPTSQSSLQPNSQIFVPYTYLTKSVPVPFYRQLNEFLIKLQKGHEPTTTGKKLEGFFKLRYGSSGNFAASSDAKLLSQMNLFLNVFSGLLSAVAVIALVVGGVGINNMMLASLSERLKELGLRKALGATPRQLKYLMLGESILLCSTAGIIGLVFGFAAYQGLVLAATRLISNLDYAWIFEPTAFVISFVAIVLTGLGSGLVPSLKAKSLDVMEALRQDI